MFENDRVTRPFGSMLAKITRFVLPEHTVPPSFHEVALCSSSQMITVDLQVTARKTTVVQ